jgi:transposase-like protein
MTPLFIEQSSVSALSHHDPSSAGFTTNIAESNIWYAQVETAVPETLAYYAFPEEHWRRIRTNNPLERIMREIRRRTRVVGAFPDGNSAINLAAARLRHIAGTRWSTKRYLNMQPLRQRNAMIA